MTFRHFVLPFFSHNVAVKALAPARAERSAKRESPATAGRAAPRTLCLQLSHMTLQKRQRLLVELLHLLIDRRMRAPLKDQQF